MLTKPLCFRSAKLTAALGLLAALAALPALGQHYNVTDLIADQTSTAPSATNPPDSNLVNSWGMSRASASPWWISDNGTGKTSFYNGTGASVLINNPDDFVTIPVRKGQTAPTNPTGTVFNYTGGFQVGPNAPAIFIFVTEDGTISGWNPGVDRKNAILKADPKGAIFKGCSIAMWSGAPFLYVTDFGTASVDVFDANFKPVPLPSWAFRDSRIPSSYSPFNIQNVGGNLVVTFAKQETKGAVDEEHGPGLGFISIFDPAGHLLQRLEHNNLLNAPWGIALAPSDFGVFSHRLLIGNFGDGTIHAFNLLTGKLEGTLLDAATGNPLTVDGLWGLNFGGGTAASGAANELFFTAGPNDESDGLLGKITAVGSEQRGNTE
jgi:uncharacterized protein (TIGR03118 family)